MRFTQNDIYPSPLNLQEWSRVESEAKRRKERVKSQKWAYANVYVFSILPLTPEISGAWNQLQFRGISPTRPSLSCFIQPTHPHQTQVPDLYYMFGNKTTKRWHGNSHSLWDWYQNIIASHKKIGKQQKSTCTFNSLINLAPFPPNGAKYFFPGIITCKKEWWML